MGKELDLRSSLTLVRLEEQRQRQRLGRRRHMGRSGGPAGANGMDSGCKIKRGARDGEHGHGQEPGLHAISSLLSCHQSSYRHRAIPIHEAPPISQFRGVRTRMAHNYRSARRLKEADAYLSPEYWDETKQILLHSTDTLSSRTDSKGRLVRS